MAFEVEAGLFGDLESIKIFDSELGHEFVFLPDKGALPIKLQFNHIEFVEPIESPEQLQSDHWFRNFWLMPYPNRTNGGHFEYNGIQYNLEMSKHDPRHALHGFFYKLWAEDIEVSNTEESVELTIKHMYHADQTGYPFPFDSSITYKVESSGKLDINIEILNTGENAMPFGIGWHPYFKLDENLEHMKCEFSSLEHIVLDENSIPTGEVNKLDDNSELTKMTLDDSFRYLEAPFQFNLSSKSTKLRISQNEELKYLQLFTPGRNSIAVEPMSCGVDALNNDDGLAHIKPGEKKKYQITIELEKV